MQRRRFTHWIFVGLIGLGLISESMAQTISTDALDVTRVCTSATLDVPFSTTGTFNSGNEFRVQLSDAAGSFASPVVLSPAGTTSPLTVTIPAGTANGTGYKVRVVSTNPVVTGAASSTTLTISAKPAAPGVVSPVEYCQFATSTALSATGTNLTWFTHPTLGSGSATAPTPVTNTVGTFNYYVSQTPAGSCESDRVQIQVIVKEKPAAPTVTTPLDLCQGTTASALTASGIGLKWYTAATGGTGSSTAPTPSTSTVGTTSYFVSQTVFGCESDRRELVVNVKATPAAPTTSSPSPTYCFGATAAPLTANTSGGATLNWYNPGGGSLGATAPTPSTATAGSTTYQVSQILSGCEGPKISITVTVNKTDAPTVPAATISYCQNATATDLSATGTALKWYTVPTGGSGSTTAPTPSTAAAGSTDYYVTQTLSGCESERTKVTVTVKPTPALPGVTAVSFCQNTTASALTATGTGLKWYNGPSGGTALGGAPTPPTTTVGTTSYYVSQTIDGCEGPRAKLDVTIKTTPTTPATTASVTYCINTTASALTATATTGATLNWYSTAGSLPGAPTPATTAAGVTTFQVSQTLDGCEGPRASITVTVFKTDAPAVTSPVEYCQNATSGALTATGTALNWYTVATGGTALSGPPTPSTATAGTTNYYVSQTLNGCESERALIAVTVKALPAAPTVSTVNICQNSTATALTATGTALKWYTVATGGTSSATAPTPTTTTVGTTSYYVSQTVNGCEGPRAKLDVTVKSTPVAPTVTEAVSLCINGPASALSASTTVTGATLNWYNAGGGSLSGAPTPSTAAAGVTTYQVSQTLDGCEGPKATITVTVYKTDAPTVASPIEYCQNATASALTATGTALKWYTVATGGTALSGTPTPSTTTVGTTNYYVSQTLNGCEGDRALIAVTVKALPTAPTVSAVSLCQGTTATALTATGTALKWYTVATGGTSLATAPTPATTTVGTTSYYVSQTVNGCEGPRAKLDVTIKTTPAAPTTMSAVPLCINTTAAALTATPVSVASLNWYNAGGGSLAGAPTPSTTAAGVTTFQVSQTLDGCEGPKATITVTVYKTDAPTVTSPIEYCQNATASALTATGAALKWYTVATGGTALSGPPTPVTTAAGTTNYYVSQTLNGCESDRASIAVTVKALPTAPTVSAVSLCQGTTATALTVDSGTALKWYTVATGGTSSATAPIPTTTTVGTTSYYVSQTVNGCEGPRAKLDVIIKTTPVAPTVADVPLCEGIPATGPLTATGVTGATFKWYTATGTSLSVPPTPTTLVAGVTTYQVSQILDGCEGPKASVKVTVYKTPAPVVDSTTIEYCRNVTAVALKATGTAMKWYTTSTGGTGATTAPVPSTSTVANTAYYVSQTLNGCESDRVRIDVIVKAIPVVPTIVAPKPICEADVALPLIGAVSGVTGTLKWYTAASGGTGASVAPTPVTTTPGTINYYVTQTINNCESPRAALPLEIKAQPARPTVTTPVEYCQNATTTALTATGTNLKWYTVASGGTALSAAPVPPSTTVATTSYYVSQSAVYTITTSESLSCEGPRAKLDVQINPLPTAPAVVASQEFCQERQDKSFTLTATGSALKWYTVATGGTGATTAPVLNLKEAKESTFYVTQSTLKGCEGPRSEMKVRVKPLPALPGVSSVVEFCQFDATGPLQATPVTNGVINWYGTNATGGSRLGSAPIPSTAVGGETAYYVSQTLEGCEGDRAQIVVRVKTTPKPTVTSPVQYCQNATAQPLSAQGTGLKWYREPTSTESQATPFVPFTANVGSFAFYVTQTGANGCESPKEKIEVTIQSLPSATISGDNSISLGQSANISIAFTGIGPWNYVLSNGVTGTGITTNPAIVTVSPERTTTYVVTEVSNACGKGIPNGSAIVTVRIPTISTGNPTIANLCAGRSFSVPFQQSGEFVTANKFNVQISLSEADAGFRTIPTVQNGNELTATIPDTTKGGSYFIRVVGEAPSVPTIRGSISPVTITVNPLPTATVTGSTAILVGQATNVNIALTGQSPWTFRFNNGTNDSLVTTNVTPFVIRVQPATTTTYKVTNLSNQCGVGRISGEARIQVDPILGVEPSFTSAWLRAYPSPVQTICVIEMDTPLVGGEATLTVQDLNGRTVITNQIREPRSEVDFSAQPSGIYFLRVENGGKVAVRRILKQN